MQRHSLWVGGLVCLCLWATPGGAAAQEPIEVRNIEYLEGVPEQTAKRRGLLLITPSKITFLSQGQARFSLDSKSVEYVAAQAKAGARTRTRETGMAVAGTAAIAIGLAVAGGGFAGPAAALFLKREKHLLSIEYFEGADKVRRLALFDVHDHSALAVKKMIDERLGLTPEYYEEKDRQEEEEQRQEEAEATPAGTLDTRANLVVGDIQYFRYLLERGKYDLLIFERYIGFRPEGMQWAKYRVAIREKKPDSSAGETLTPIYSGSRLVGFRYNGTRYLFY